MHAHPVSLVTQRALAIVALAVALVLGMWCSGRLARQSSARVQEIRAEERDVDQARADAAARRAELTSVDAVFERALAEDATRFGLPTPGLAAFREPHRHAVELQDAIVLQPGKSWSSPHLSITANVEKVTYQQHGATVSANHSLVRIVNVAKVPVAYLVRLASEDRGRCEVRGARAHNANALRPDELAEIVVCAGSGAVRIEHVEVLELDELGQRYISQLPPDALGQDEVTAASHQPFERVEPCRSLDAAVLSGWIRDGTTSWADVVDYFSRHDCHRYAFVRAYRRATTALPGLPVLP